MATSNISKILNIKTKTVSGTTNNEGRLSLGMSTEDGIVIDAAVTDKWYYTLVTPSQGIYGIVLLNTNTLSYAANVSVTVTVWYL